MAIAADSIQKIARASGTTADAIVEPLHELAHTAGCAVLMTSHVNKAGAISGPMQLQRDADVVLFVDGDPEAGPERTLIVHKNRFGPAHLKAHLVVDANGIVEVPSNVTPIRPLTSP